MNEKIVSIIANYTKCENIAPESDLITDLGINSIDLVSMMMDFEDEFGISVPDDKLAAVKTVQDIADLLK